MSIPDEAILAQYEAMQDALRDPWEPPCAPYSPSDYNDVEIL